LGFKSKYLFLKDVFLLSTTAFGGPQAHFSYFLSLLVTKRKYITEETFIEINALCQVLPGPTSTQTLTAIGYKIGGPTLAFLTLFVWILPSVIFMSLMAVVIDSFASRNMSLIFTRFVPAIAVGLVSYAAYVVSLKSVHTSTGIFLMIVTAVLCYFFRSSYFFPATLLIAGMITALKYKSHPEDQMQPININWSNFILWATIFILAAGLGLVTKLLPIRLFENFYRNGSLIFGGGQVLTPLLYTEFVELKHYLTSREFLSGYAVSQSIPGPTFSFSAYIGALAMRKSGILGQLTGGFVAALGIFLPGTFLIFFLIRFWDGLKKYRIVRASLEGITAASAGLVATTAIILFQPLDNEPVTYAFTIGTFLLLNFTKISPAVIILLGLLLGLL